MVRWYSCRRFGSINCLFRKYMVPFQTITGFFDNVAEAQQAVQRLLLAGFTADQVQFSARPAPTDSLGRATGPTAGERNTGRFLTSLFGTTNEGIDLPDPGHEDTPPAAGTLVAVQVRSAPEATQVMELLTGASTIRTS